MKNENPAILSIVISFAWRLLDIFEKYIENENFQISNLRFLRFFISSKSCNRPKPLKIVFFVLYDMTYIQKAGNGNTYMNLPIN